MLGLGASLDVKTVATGPRATLLLCRNWDHTLSHNSATTLGRTQVTNRQSLGRNDACVKKKQN